MKQHYRVALATHPLCLAHDPGIGQPENPFRLQAILQALSSSGYTYEQDDVDLSLSAIEAVHGVEYLLQLEDARGMQTMLEMETFTSASSVDAAFMSASIGCDLVERILKGTLERGFALVRPPGHHASATVPMGYCILNNVAVAVQSAKKHGAKRIAIIDFDVHHGNGTQEILSGDPDCVHIDLHQKNLFPEQSGSIDACGKKPAKGHLINVQLPPECSGREYMRVMEEIVSPVLRSFQPDIIFVSAGYDAHEYDGLSDMKLVYVDYYNMIRYLCGLAEELCQGRVVCFLEGGYSIGGLQSSALATVAALCGHRCPDIPVYPVRFRKVAGFESMMKTLKRKIVDVYWK